MASLFEQFQGLFGWNFKPKDKPVEDHIQDHKSFQAPIYDDGAMQVASGGVYGTYIDLDGSAKSEAELIARYRDMAQQPEVDSAIEDVVDEAIVMDDDYVVRLNTDKLEVVSDSVKKKIKDEFENVLELYQFNTDAYTIFKRWYVDGRLYYHAIIDDASPKAGLQELRYIDPRKIRKVREIKTDNIRGVDIQTVVDEYYMYTERGFSGAQAQLSAYMPDSTTMAGVKITKDAIIQVTSGITDQNNQLVLSYLHKALKTLNQLRALEDAIVIYRISRAPERRIFYIDVGNLPKVQAEQYIREMMVNHKNRLVYNATTGEFNDDRKMQTMMEDYYLARREGGRGTEIDVLPAGENLGELTDVEYFQKKLYRALGVPISRLDPSIGMTIGRASEISRDEVKFSRFIGRMRRQFSKIFTKALEKQLLLKNIITPDEWPLISRQISFDWVEDNHFEELKNLEILSNQLQAADQIRQFVGITHSWKWVRQNIFQQSEDDIEELDKQIEEESDDPQFIDPEVKMMQVQTDLDMQTQQHEIETQFNQARANGGGSNNAPRNSGKVTSVQKPVGQQPKRKPTVQGKTLDD